jgi:hypothetical protein
VGKDRVQITFDYSVAPDLQGWTTKAHDFIEKWYPVIVKRLAVDGLDAPMKMDVQLNDSDGIGGTGLTHIEFSAKWVRHHPDDWGAMVFLLAHVAQNYPRYDPPWLVDGVADYVDARVYKDPSRKTAPDPNSHKYTEGYWVSGAFLVWMEKTYDRHILEHVNEVLRKDDYTPDFWKAYKGKTLDELWAEYQAWYAANNPKHPNWVAK